MPPASRGGLVAAVSRVLDTHVTAINRTLRSFADYFFGSDSGGDDDYDDYDRMEQGLLDHSCLNDAIAAGDFDVAREDRKDKYPRGPIFAHFHHPEGFAELPDYGALVEPDKNKHRTREEEEVYFDGHRVQAALPAEDPPRHGS